MKNIDNINPFESIIKKTEFGIETTLVADVKVSDISSIQYANKSILATNVDGKNETYKLVYTIIDLEGKEQSFVEDDGILPTLFISPNKEVYVSVIPYHPDKELEISIPVFNRENTELPKGCRPFTGEFIGISNQYSIFYDVDPWSDTKPDKLLAIEFKSEVIKKKHNVKVPLPRNNKIFISNNEVHLLAKDTNGWLHRQIDEKGNEIKQRRINTEREFFEQIISLSFEKETFLLAQEKGNIIIEKVDTNGSTQIVNLIDINDPFYNTWQPVKIAENTFVTRFNGEFGNGWFTIHEEKLLEFFYSKDVTGYRNLLTNEVLEMEANSLVISSINNTTENAYAIFFYPKGDSETKSNKLIVLNRQIK